MSRRLRRTWPQRLVLGLNALLVVACIAAAGLVWYGNNRLGALERVDIQHIRQDPTPTAVLDAGGGKAASATTVDTIPLEAVGAQNFLLVGSDSRDCIDPSSPYAGAFLNEEFAGNRSDTIMLLRVDPKTEQAAILSFPRDLWVKIAGTGRRSRINSAFDKNDPSTLVQTIEQGFGVPVDHYVEVDFCAFKNLVDAVGGVKIPFKYPTRDKNTGLDVQQPGCVAFDGDAALAYVRSRHYEWFDGKRWRSDDSSDFGRIKRQQEFIRRALQRAIDRGARNPAVAKNLIDTALQNVRVDRELTIRELLSLATQLRTFDPNRVRTFRIDGTGTVIGGAQVILPDTTSRSARQLLAVFQGKAQLGDLPDQPAPRVDDPSTTVGRTTSTPKLPIPTAKPAPTTTVAGAPPTVVLADSNDGVYPPDDPACR